MGEHVGLCPRIGHGYVFGLGLLGHVDGDQTRRALAAYTVERGAVGLDVSLGRREEVWFAQATPRRVALLFVVFLDGSVPVERRGGDGGACRVTGSSGGRGGGRSVS